MFRNRAAIVIRQAHLDRGEAELVQPAADVLLFLPARVPLREDDDGGRSLVARGKQLRVDAIVRGPGRGDAAGEREYVVRDCIVVCRRDGIPIIAVGDCVRDIAVEEGARICVRGVAAQVFDAPSEGKRAPLRFLVEAHLLVTTDSFFVPGWHWASK